MSDLATTPDETRNPRLVPSELSALARGDIQVIGRVAALLECFTPQSQTLDAQRAAAVLGVGRSSAHRYLTSMEKSGLLRREGTATYVLGPVLARLGTLALAGSGLVESAGPVMQELALLISGTIVLSVWGGKSPVVARVVRDTRQTTTVSIDVGRSLEPDSAQSLVFAAYLSDQDDPRLRRYHAAGGHAVLVARHTYASGALKAIAVPVVGSDGAIAATLAVLGFAATLPDADDDQTIARLIAGAGRLGKR